MCAALLFGGTAATAQSLPCASVSAEVREYVRNRGACSDAKTGARPRASTQSKSSTSGNATSAHQAQSVPDIVGRSYTDAAPALAKFKIERIERASAAPAGEVLAQEPAPAALVRPGSTVILQVSDGSLARAASAHPVTAASTATAASSAPAPATSLAPASPAVALPPQELVDPPKARAQFPIAIPASAALIFVAGVLLGLLSGALLMRQRLLRGQVAVGENALQPTLSRRWHSVDQRPPESEACGLPQTSASSESRFEVRLVPTATTVVLAPLADTDEISIEHSSDYQACEQVRLQAPIEVSGDDVEMALAEQGKDDSAVEQVFERLRGVAAERAADELNRALDIDILDVLAQGWIQIPAMHRAVQLSALTRGRPELIGVQRHNIASASHVVLDTRVAGSSLPPLELSLEIVVDVQSATLAARDGRIEVVALGEATVLARLKYKSVLVKEHATEISGTPRDPSESQRPAPEQLTSVDFPI